jgi:hypothetical protein
MQVHRPGILSKVVSPIQTDLTVLTGAGGKVTIELLGEDGRVISYQELNYFRMGRSLRINPEVPFEISSVSEMARLQVTTADEFGRMVARASVDLILLSVGRNVINPPSIVHESYVIRSPRREATVQGGHVDNRRLGPPGKCIAAARRTGYRERPDHGCSPVGNYPAGWRPQPHAIFARDPIHSQWANANSHGVPSGGQPDTRYGSAVQPVNSSRTVGVLRKTGVKKCGSRMAHALLANHILFLSAARAVEAGIGWG